MNKIALIAEYNPTSETHIATNRALEHSAKYLDIPITAEWISTEDLTPQLFDKFQGIWVGTGSPYKNMPKTLSAIQFARENGVPTLATCGGFQHLIIELARNVLGFEDAEHGEYNPNASRLFISELTCSLAGRDMNIELEPGSQVNTMYGSANVQEKYYCNFGVNPNHIDDIKNSQFRVAGSDDESKIRIIELPGHRFFIGTLFVPQAQSTPERPHPLINGFISAVAESQVS